MPEAYFLFILPSIEIDILSKVSQPAANRCPPYDAHNIKTLPHLIILIFTVILLFAVQTLLFIIKKK